MWPDWCPHCGNPATRTRRFAASRYTDVAAARPGSRRKTHLFYDVPVCERVWSPNATRVFLIVAIYWTICFGFAAAMDDETKLKPLVALGVSALATVWAYRAHTRFRIATYDAGSITLKTRRRDYAEELAALNQSRVAARST